MVRIIIMVRTVIRILIRIWIFTILHIHINANVNVVLFKVLFQLFSFVSKADLNSTAFIFWFCEKSLDLGSQMVGCETRGVNARIFSDLIPASHWWHKCGV